MKLYKKKIRHIVSIKPWKYQWYRGTDDQPNGTETTHDIICVPTILPF